MPKGMWLFRGKKIEVQLYWPNWWKLWPWHNKYEEGYSRLVIVTRYFGIGALQVRTIHVVIL